MLSVWRKAVRGEPSAEICTVLVVRGRCAGNDTSDFRAGIKELLLTCTVDITIAAALACRQLLIDRLWNEGLGKMQGGASRMKETVCLICYY